ncbi:hypothetical protein B0T26DRAFT_450236 [Lasiosphaeria miniovina]|uniref:Uncharacterized protein n=1 Tax=Lasiosphaeria miniovina TaxID=1954250 RepID=A0AA39ZZQ4_9PEZI|nr:uncharacterized protein B0T26DRAFT_450236 [Lasiosphaeria miniovina]KAK0706359.1 hypothetical protein B0T26DRAFT_450236 [Lasiosphaeria miniovina]
MIPWLAVIIYMSAGLLLRTCTWHCQASLGSVSEKPERKKTSPKEGELKSSLHFRSLRGRPGMILPPSLLD